MKQTKDTTNMNIVVDGIEIDLKVGADPEVFVVNEQGHLVSAHGMVSGTKEAPEPVASGAIQVDGMALEFNIDPAKDREEFVKNMSTVMGQLVKRLPKGHKLSQVSTAEFGASYIQKQPHEAKELGCSADLSAYTEQENPKPNSEAPFRTAAGHVHIGWTEGADTGDSEYADLCYQFTKVLDLYLGVPSVLLDPDTKRRQLYGQAGALRIKTYGLEYRVLSNFWLKSKELTGYVYSQTEAAIRSFLGGMRVDDADVPKAINTSDKALASSLMTKYGVPSYA